MGDPRAVYATVDNAGDVLPQAEWAVFASKFIALIRSQAMVVHGAWPSASTDRVQSLAVGFDVSRDDIAELQLDLALLAGEYRLPHVTWSEGRIRTLTARTSKPEPIVAALAKYCDDHPFHGEKVQIDTPDLVLEVTADGDLMLRSEPEYLRLTLMVLEREQLGFLHFEDGLLSIRGVNKTLTYQPLYHDRLIGCVTLRRTPDFELPEIIRDCP